jgi:hypothetical protein
MAMITTADVVSKSVSSTARYDAESPSFDVDNDDSYAVSKPVSSMAGRDAWKVNLISDTDPYDGDV